MGDMISELTGQGVRLRSYAVGSHKTTCPKCSHTRKKKNDPCLWVNIKNENLALWKCHNCMWKGGAGDVASENHQPMERQREYVAPKPPAQIKSMPQKVTDYLVSRGLTPEVITQHDIYWSDEKKCICFPYKDNGKLINVKYRSLDKKFWMEKNARLIFYGVDDVRGSDDVIIVEGEFDKLALAVCGIKNVVSVPNGAPARIREDEDEEIDNRGQFEYLIHAEEILKNAKRVILAVDHDQAGDNLRFELARRIGVAKCYTVQLPEKDANDTLCKRGVDVLCDAIHDISPIPISGLYQVSDFVSEVDSYYDGTSAFTRGLSTGWWNVDALYTVVPGELTIITGLPNSGKSEWLDALMVNLAKHNEWRFAVFSPENRKAKHVLKLAEKIIEAPLVKRDHPLRASRERYIEGRDWVNAHFHFVISDDDKNLPTVDFILEKAKAAIYRYGINAIVIDPYNEIEHQRPSGMFETEYVSMILSKIKRFAKTYGVKVWLVAHPTKISPDKDGEIRMPTLYDISGSAHFVNKPDNGIVVFRVNDAAHTSEIHTRKIREKDTGEIGVARLQYDKDTGRYSAPPPPDQAEYIEASFLNNDDDEIVTHEV